jgi:hypothetical protein
MKALLSIALISHARAGWFGSIGSSTPKEYSFDAEQSFDKDSNQIQQYSDDLSENYLQGRAFTSNHGKPVSSFPDLKFLQSISLLEPRQRGSVGACSETKSAQ